MASRTLLSNAIPEAYKTMLTLNEQVESAALAVGVDKSTLELVKIRVSQINGCAFCLRMHTRDALGQGETSDRLAVLSAWRETQYFSATEQAALALAEEITVLAGATPAGAGDPGLADAAALSAEQAAVVRWAAIVINSFNRLAIGSHYTVKP